MHFGDRLAERIEERGPVCAGVDPRPERLPAGLDASGWGEEVAGLLGERVAALKPQLAFFGDDWTGPTRLAQAAGPLGALTIADCKRGDIGSTATAYAERLLGPGSPFDALTLNPYLGRDALEPFVSAAVAAGKGLFVLVRTSNPGFADLQGLVTGGGGERVFERTARLVHELGAGCVGARGLSSVGAVVGLTAPVADVRRLRELMPRAPFLMPGYGAQGGDPAVLEAARTDAGPGALVNASRSLTLPWEGPAPADWRDRILAALETMRKDLAG